MSKVDPEILDVLLTTKVLLAHHLHMLQCDPVDVAHGAEVGFPFASKSTHRIVFLGYEAELGLTWYASKHVFKMFRNIPCEPKLGFNMEESTRCICRLLV